MAGRTSLKDIATAIGVSVSTVSLALAGNKRVSAKTRTRVRDMANQLGYVPDLRLASFASGRFRHPGKPISIALSAERLELTSFLRQKAEAMGMSIRIFESPIENLIADAEANEASAIILNRRGFDLHQLANSPLPIVVWEDDGPANPPVDVIETCEWWTATTEVIQRIRSQGFRKTAAILTPANPYHWHDEVRLACIRSHALPVMEFSQVEESVLAFVKEHRPDSLIVGMPFIAEVLKKHHITIPLICLLVPDDPWFQNYTGWVGDLEHRSQVTLELIEQRLRYGVHHPRRIVIPPRWQEGKSLKA
jgi:DNA-binding LacI/PurR family transcriptional regulator